MYEISITKAVEIIKYLIFNTSWGKRTSSKEMLILISNECKELEFGIVINDIKNVMEEVSDINMMLMYFCFKLQSKSFENIKKLFEEAATEVERISISDLNAKDVYKSMYSGYKQLINKFEIEQDNFKEMYEIVKIISRDSLSIACIMSNKCKAEVINMVFNLIISKLKRRYAPHFKEQVNKNDITFLEEENWNFGKELEKDIPFMYCNNSLCKHYKKVGISNVQFNNDRVICVTCNSIVDREYILLSHLTSKKRRNILEELDNSILKYSKGDDFKPYLYIYNNADDYLDVLIFLVDNIYPLDEFLLFLTKRNNVLLQVVKEFISKCTYNIFIDANKVIKGKKREITIRHCINENLSYFLDVLTANGLGRNMIKNLIFYSVDCLYSKKDVNIPVIDGKKITINLSSRHTVFTVIKEIKNVLDDINESIEYICIQNVRQDVKISLNNIIEEYILLNTSVKIVYGEHYDN